MMRSEVRTRLCKTAHRSWAAISGSSCGPPAAQQIDNYDYQRNHQQKMDQPASDMHAETFILVTTAHLGAKRQVFGFSP